MTQGHGLSTTSTTWSINSILAARRLCQGCLALPALPKQRKCSLDLQDMLIKPVQRYIKRQVEKEIFAVIVAQNGFEAAKAKVRLNFGSPETPEMVPGDLIRAAELGLVRAEEFRKNAVKFGWELWDDSSQQPNQSDNSESNKGGD